MVVSPVLTGSARLANCRLEAVEAVGLCRSAGATLQIHLQLSSLPFGPLSKDRVAASPRPHLVKAGVAGTPRSVDNIFVSGVRSVWVDLLLFHCLPAWCWKTAG